MKIFNEAHEEFEAGNSNHWSLGQSIGWMIAFKRGIFANGLDVYPFPF
jgi:hypothetical protein